MHLISVCSLQTQFVGNYAFKIDLQDAYFQQKIPQVRLREQVGPVSGASLRSDYQIFTRLGHTVTFYLHRLGISVIPYLDHQAQLIVH